MDVVRISGINQFLIFTILPQLLRIFQMVTQLRKKIKRVMGRKKTMLNAKLCGA